MAAQLITLPYRPVINLLGGIEAGAELDVFLSGSTTRVEIFSDGDLTVELSNPLEADSAGRFPPVYYDDSVAIRFRLRANNNTVLADIDPYLPDFATTEAARDAAAASAAAALVSESNAEAAVTDAAEQVDLAEAAAVVAQSFTGPLYANTAAGLAATTDGEGFAVDNGDGTADVYQNSVGIAVFVRTIILDSTASGTAALIGTTGGDLQSVLNAIGGSAVVDLTADVTGVLPVANGGTGGSTAGAARTALGAAASGANTDITSIRRSTTISASGTVAVNSVGYMGFPLSAKTQGSNITVDLDDIAHMVMNTAGGWTIPPNASVNFPLRVGFVGYNDSSSSQTVTPGVGVTLRLLGTATIGARTVLQRGFFVVVQIKTNEWGIQGNIT